MERRLYLPYGAEQLFDLVADVERYPDFVPGWRKARVTRRERDYLIVEQSVRIGPADWQFITEAHFDRPRTIRISALNAPFGELSIDWTFNTLEDAGCSVTFHAQHEAGPRILRKFAGEMMERRLLKMIEAFEARAQALYCRASA